MSGPVSETTKGTFIFEHSPDIRMSFISPDLFGKRPVIGNDSRAMRSEIRVISGGGVTMFFWFRRVDSSVCLS